MKSWLDFWNAPNAIYVSRRHQEAHYAKVVSGIGGFVPAGGEAVVLDWGCGDAFWPTSSRKRAGPCCSTTAPRPRAAG